MVLVGKNLKLPCSLMLILSIGGKNRFGFRFIGEDTETMTHLRRLLDLNIGSSETIDKEISFWLKDD